MEVKASLVFKMWKCTIDRQIFAAVDFAKSLAIKKSRKESRVFACIEKKCLALLLFVILSSIIETHLKISKSKLNLKEISENHAKFN